MLYFKGWSRFSTQMPERGAPAGHNRRAHLVSYFPVLINSDFFVDSRRLGYDYDDMVETGAPAAAVQHASMTAEDGDERGESLLSVM